MPRTLYKGSLDGGAEKSGFARAFLPSRPLVKNNIRRYWPGSAIMLFVYLVAALAMYTEASNMRYYAYSSGPSNIYVSFIAGENLAILSGLFAFFSGLVAAMLCFRYLMNQRDAVMAHSLPIRREAHLSSAALSGVILLGAPIAAGGLLFFAAYAFNGFFFPFEALQWVLANFAVALLSFCIAAFFSMTTGNVIAHGILTLVLTNLPFLVEGVLISYCSRFFFGFVSWTPVTLKINFFYRFATYFSAASARYQAAAPPDIITPLVYIAVGALFLLITALLYKRRRIETAGDVISLRQIRPFLRYGSALGFAFLSGMIYTGAAGYDFAYSAVWEIVFSIIGGAFGFFFAESFIRGTIRVFKRHFIGAVGFSLAFITIFLVLYYDLPRYGDMKLDGSSVELIIAGENYNNRAQNALLGESFFYPGTMFDLDIDDPDGFLSDRSPSNYYLTRGPLPQYIASQILEQDPAVLRGDDAAAAIAFQHFIADNARHFSRAPAYDNTGALYTDYQNNVQYFNIPFAARLNDGKIVRREYQMRVFFGGDGLASGVVEENFLNHFSELQNINSAKEIESLKKSAEKALYVNMNFHVPIYTESASGEPTDEDTAEWDKYGYDNTIYDVKHVTLNRGEWEGLAEAYALDGMYVTSGYMPEPAYKMDYYNNPAIAYAEFVMPDMFSVNFSIMRDDYNSIEWLIRAGLISAGSLEYTGG